MIFSVPGRIPVVEAETESTYHAASEAMESEAEVGRSRLPREVEMRNPVCIWASGEESDREDEWEESTTQPAPRRSEGVFLKILVRSRAGCHRCG